MLSRIQDFKTDFRWNQCTALLSKVRNENSGFRTYQRKLERIYRLYKRGLVTYSTFNLTTSKTNKANYITLDSLQSSHPISVPVNHPDEINEIFDSISYGKGASVIRMMANFLGLETFNGGITNYLNMHKYGNAKQVSS